MLYINGLHDDVICDIDIYADDITLYSKCNLASDLWQQKKKQTNKNFMAPFYGWGSTASRLVPLRGTLLFTTKFPEIPGTHFINLGRMKG